MTAAFDAERGTGQFTDALSGSDGTRDPSVLMPVLDVYPDALSATMPVDAVSVIVPPTPRPLEPAAVRATPPAGPGPSRRAPASPGRAPGSPGRAPAASPGRAPAAARGPRPGQPPVGRVVDQQGRPLRPGPARPVGPTSANPPARQAAPRPPVAPLTSQGRAMTASDLTAMFRTMRSGQTERLDRLSFQATHPQSSGSGAPSAVAPAAPMSSQYSARGQSRNTAREQASERRRVSSMTPGTTSSKKASSTWAVIVFLFVIAFSTGLGQRAIQLFNELFNR